MKILVINSGSSSLKYQLINMKTETVLAKGLCDRIGLEKSFLKHAKGNEDSKVYEKDLPDHKAAIKEVLNALTDAETGVISDMSEIKAVGHRVVHGGEKFSDSVLITDKVIEAINECVELAPLHNPPNIVGIKACQEIMPDTPMVAVFDTAFHQTMPKEAYMYGIPYELYEKYGIRKYGFHGTSHKYVANVAANYVGKPLNDIKLISCHLGNGASICAVKNGKSIETSMGFTPLDGLIMGTRSGSLDPSVVPFIMEKENLSTKEVADLLNKKSGVLGVSGVSSDFRDIDTAIEAGNERAKIALDLFCYRAKKYIGEYTVVMNGVDVVVFTAGIGENNAIAREMILENLDYLGIKIDKVKNTKRGEDIIEISSDDSNVKVLVIATNEELAIARETKDIIQQ